MAMLRDAVFSTNKVYRYKLMREWDKSKEKVIFIMLNPSTADHRKDDPTINRCISFAKSWGYGSLDILNLFAFRSPYPEILFKAKDPIGPRNKLHLKKAMAEGSDIVCAWGSLKKYREVEKDFMQNYANHDFYCIKRNKDGSPAHPLYLRADSKLKLWL